MGALAAVGLTTYRVSVELASTRVTVGDAALGQVVLTNPSARRVGASTVELPVGEGLAAFRAKISRKLTAPSLLPIRKVLPSPR